jgi:hypothetical protein
MTRSWRAFAVGPLAALALTACGNSEATRAAAPEPAPQPVAVSTAVVEERAVPTTLEVVGTLTADARTDGPPGSTAHRPGAGRARPGGGGRRDRRPPRRAGCRQPAPEAEATEGQTRARLGLTDGAPSTRARPPRRGGRGP